jgi:8-oxo-dGTP pyrophosphatase MutT (NUDIX family)
MTPSPQERQWLGRLLARARIPPPRDWQPWRLQRIPQPLGWMPAERAQALAAQMPAEMPLVRVEDGWVWEAGHADAAHRSEVLQRIAEEARRCGLLAGWRNERYDCWGSIEQPWPFGKPPLFRLERAAFRYFGLRSHAVHIHGLTHGLTAGQKMWCGRRALSKPTDPGRLDNLAAGGLAAGEDPAQCALRELAEEAGLERRVTDLQGPMLQLVTERVEPEGWHNERLFIFSICVDQAQSPINRDAEVSEFLCLSLPTVLERMRAGEFTADAACAIAAWLLNRQSASEP